MPPLPAVDSVQWGSLGAAFFQIVLIDVTLASDNAVAVGMAAAGLPQAKRRLAITLGLGGAVVLLCVLAFLAQALLKWGGGGLLIAGGGLLLLVGRQMWRDLRRGAHAHHGEGEASSHKTLRRALTLIFVADMSTSLDNVLAIAGAARGQPWWLLPLGLAISVAMTGFAAAWVAKLMHRWPWIGYIGLVIVVFVALHMVWDGAADLRLIRL